MACGSEDVVFSVADFSAAWCTVHQRLGRILTGMERSGCQGNSRVFAGVHEDDRGFVGRLPGSVKQGQHRAADKRICACEMWRALSLEFNLTARPY